jgi:hypothetical protein
MSEQLELFPSVWEDIATARKEFDALMGRSLDMFAREIQNFIAPITKLATDELFVENPFHINVNYDFYAGLCSWVNDGFVEYHKPNVWAVMTGWMTPEDIEPDNRYAFEVDFSFDTDATSRTFNFNTQEDLDSIKRALFEECRILIVQCLPDEDQDLILENEEISTRGWEYREDHKKHFPD